MKNTIIRPVVVSVSLFLLLSSLAIAEPQLPATVEPAPGHDKGWFDRQQVLNDRVKQGHADVLFIGDSITHGWENGEPNKIWQKYYGRRNAVNLGISGDRTQQVLWRLEHGNLDGIKPKLAVLMIGTNNSGSDSPDDIAAGVKAIVASLHQKSPTTKILVLAIFPRGADPSDPKRQVNMKANERIAKLADGDSVTFLDIGPKFFGPDGKLSHEIMPDLLHLSPQGYAIWAASIEPTVAMLLGDSATSEPAAAANTAWISGYPRAGLHNADALLKSFQARAKGLTNHEKLRVLIIGDSLSDGSYHWSHYFRKNLQTAYGNGGPGNLWAIWAGGAPGRNFAPSWLKGWLFDDSEFDSYKGPKGQWRDSWGDRGDIWPYLGWNGQFMATDSTDAEFNVDAVGSKFTVVYSSGAFATFDGHPVPNRSAGFTATLDGERQVIPPAAADAPLDIGLARFTAAEGPHKLKLDAIHDGTLWLHGTLVEHEQPGVVVYNIAHGGYWAHNYIWRQPGWDKLLAEMNPDLTIIFLSKPEGYGSGQPSQMNDPVLEFKLLTKRVTEALPHTKIFFMVPWSSRDGSNQRDEQTITDRMAWFDQNHYPYLDLFHGLDRQAMAKLGWYQDSIHLTQPGGQGIGDEISKLFLP